MPIAESRALQLGAQPRKAPRGQGAGTTVLWLRADGLRGDHVLLDFPGKRWRRDHHFRLPVCGSCHRGEHGIHGFGSERIWLNYIGKSEAEMIACVKGLWGNDQDEVRAALADDDDDRITEMLKQRLAQIRNEIAQLTIAEELLAEILLDAERIGRG